MRRSCKGWGIGSQCRVDAIIISPSDLRFLFLFLMTMKFHWRSGPPMKMVRWQYYPWPSFASFFPSSLYLSTNVVMAPASVRNRRSTISQRNYPSSPRHPLTPFRRRCSSHGDALNKSLQPITVIEAVYSIRLLEALRKGDSSALAPFLDKDPTKPGPVRELTSPLHLAVRCAESSTIKLILQNKNIDINLVESQYGNTALHLASSTGRADVVQEFLSIKEIDDNIRNADGRDPLEVAKSPRIAQIFQGTIISQKEMRWSLVVGWHSITSPLAVSRGELNFAFQELLERWERETPGTNEEMVDFLKQRRAAVVDLNVKSRSSGTTLLHEAVRRKDTSLIELAVRKGVDVFVRNKRGKRVLETTKDEKIKALLQQCEWPKDLSHLFKLLTFFLFSIQRWCCYGCQFYFWSASYLSRLPWQMDQLCRWLQDKMVCAWKWYSILLSHSRWRGKTIKRIDQLTICKNSSW